MTLLIAVAAIDTAALAAAEPAAQAIMWPELIPEEYRGRTIYTPPPADELDVEAGDLIGMQPPSSGVRGDLAGKRIRIPGFVVPLEFDAERRITRFFLVPFFGACIHFPPPPANQTVYVIVNKGFTLKTIYDPYEITGVMEIASQTTKLGASEYTLHATSMEPYVQ